MEINLSRVLGHETPKAFFKYVLENDEWAPAYIFEGPEGVGKATFAHEVVKAATCERDKKPCQLCSSCRRIQNFQYPDLWILLPDKPEGLRERMGEGKVRPEGFDPSREISIRQVRYLKGELSRPPFEGKRRFILVLNAENLSLPAQNAMLKILEEPPSHTTFFLISSFPERVLPTIRSRSRRIQFSPLPYKTFIKYPFETDIPLPLLFRLSSGCIGGALELLSSEVWEVRRAFLQGIKEGRIELLLDTLYPFIDKKNISALVDILATLGRDLLFSKLGLEDLVIHRDLKKEIAEASRRMNFYGIESFIKGTLQSQEGIRKYLSPTLIIPPLLEPLIRNKSSLSGMGT
jgi:DNA polymerase-3 subunit delta'